MTEKRCSKCGEVKVLSEFNKSARAKDGLQSQCKGCDKRWREEHPGHSSTYNKRWREEHPEKVVAQEQRRLARGTGPAQSKAWREANPGKVVADHARWREANPDYAKEYFAENREKIAAARSIWRQKNRDKKARYARRRRALKAGVPSEPYERDAVLGFWDYECAYCGTTGWTRATKDNYNGEATFATRLTIDHIVALECGGPDNFDNVVAACWSCNSSKNDRQLGEWIWERFPQQEVAL